MEKKLEDLGRDLIATQNNKIHIVQCKYWAQHKTIHEKHIAQLYGTTIALSLEKDPLWEIIPVLMTNTKLSETAEKFAKRLNVQLQYVELKEFPRIKCNIGKDENGIQTKIYHLPFDQQYDKTRVRGNGDFFAYTVQEAAAKGFRRAFKYFGN